MSTRGELRSTQFGNETSSGDEVIEQSDAGYEYQVIRSSNDNESMQYALNKLGEQGFMICGIACQNIILMRPYVLQIEQPDLESLIKSAKIEGQIVSNKTEA